LRTLSQRRFSGNLCGFYDSGGVRQAMNIANAKCRSVLFELLLRAKKAASDVHHSPP